MKKNVLALVLLFTAILQLQAQQGVPNLPVSGDNTNNEIRSCVLKTGVKPKKLTVGDISDAPHPSRADEIYTLPVVFHHVHSNKTQTIDLTTIDAYVKLLNDAFSLQTKRFVAAKLANKIPQIVLDQLPDPADTRIRFCLAHTDKEGNATSGVVDKRINGFAPVYFSPDSDKLYDDALGGSTLWPKDKYINIYVVENLDSGDDYGYANAEAIVLDENKLFQDEGTIPHEMGHFLGLEHTWGGLTGNDKGCGDLDDGITDTPPQEAPSQNHKDYKYIKSSGGYFVELISCDNKAKGGNQYINFMDYSFYGMIFTKGQKDAMRKYIESNLASVKDNGKCNIGKCINDEYDQKAANSDFNTATAITPEELQNNNGVATKGNYTGLLCQNDVDVYSFKGIANRQLRIVVQHPYETSQYGAYLPYLFKIKTELYKKVGNEYKLIAPTGSNDYDTYFIIKELQKGDEQYFIKIKGLTAKDFHPYIRYEMRIKNFALENLTPDCYKADKNQTPANATYIPDPVLIGGGICSGKDVDYYKIYLSGDDNLENMSNNLSVKLDGMLKDLDMTIFSLAGNNDIQLGLNENSIISTAPKNGTTAEVQDLNVSKGWYYIEIKAKPGIDDYVSYLLNVDFSISFEQGIDNAFNCPDGDKVYEPNEEDADAYPIKPSNDDGVISTYLVKDYICPANDTDVYEFTLDGPGDVTVHLYGKDVSNYLPEDYNLYLIGEKEGYYYSQTDGPEWEKIIANNLAAGKYFISVYAPDKFTHDSKNPYYLNVYVNKKDGKVVPNDKPIINLYPNPPKDNVTISISNKLTTKTAQLIITDLYGKVFTNKTAAFVNGNLTSPVNVTNLPKGLYTVTIKDIKTGQQYHKRLAKE